MGGTVATKANYYEVLGLTPAANEAQIARAFADAMSMFRVRPVAALAEISSAYETLRNAAKRREYDRSIGIAPPPAPAPAPRQWAIAAPPVRWAPLTGSPAEALAQADRAPAARAEQPNEREAVSAIAASLREIARPDALEPRDERKPERTKVPKAGPAIPAFLAEPRLDADDAVEAEERAFDWTRPALAICGFVIAAGVIGTFAGLSVRDNAQSIGGEQSITAALPTPKAHARTAAPVEVAQAGEDVQSPVPPPQPRRTAPRHRTSSWVEHSVAQAGEATTVALPAAAEEARAADPLAPQGSGSDAAPAKPVAATMPLPNGVVARTIERIGYSCGRVASAEAVDGAPGVFKVTCTSGQSYQASPVHGRYRFRKLGGR